MFGNKNPNSETAVAPADCAATIELLSAALSKMEGRAVTILDQLTAQVANRDAEALGACGARLLIGTSIETECFVSTIDCPRQRVQRIK